MRTFIIHMDGDTRRRPNADRLAGILPGAEIVPAVMGRDHMQTVPTRPGDLFAPRYPFALGPGELGCFLSHRACWQRIVDEDLDCALIVEDDLGLDPGPWADAMELFSGYAGPDTFIRLPAKARETPARVIATHGAARLFLPRVIGLQTVAQVVGREAARRLLAASDTVDRPVDTFLQMHWATGQPIHTILPNGVSELTGELGGSTIQKKTRTGSRIARELKRAAYRARVALRPQTP